MSETPTARALGQIHQRIDSHDHRIKQLEIVAARQEATIETIAATLKEIRSGITWIIQLVIGGIVAGGVAFILAGGLQVVSP